MNNRIVAVEKKDGKKCHDCLSTPLSVPSGEVTRGIPASRPAGVSSVHPILLSSKIVGWGLAVHLARQGGDLVSDTIG